MRYLLDVNVVVALLIAAHEHHEKTEAWIETLGEQDEVLLCPWTEMGFIRVALAAHYLSDISTARRILMGFKAARALVGFVNDDRRSQHLPSWVKTHAQIGDGHLFSIAVSSGANLVTWDRGITVGGVLRSG